MYDQGAMGLAKMRRDGFVGLRGGVATTRPVRFSGRRLFVNLSGTLEVDVLDEAGALLKTLTPVSGDRTLLAVDDVSAFAGRPVRFRFRMGADSTLYSFWVSRSDRGESMGYLAGGGPGYRGIRDDVKVETRSLDGAWKFIRDGQHFKGVTTAAFDDSAWQNVTVPHDWAISGPFNPETRGWQGKLPWHGAAWYRRKFTLEADAWREIVAAKKALYLEFDGVMARPEVWVNGEKAGGWDYGYMSFQLDVTKFLKAGENTLAVRCNTHSHSSRWYPGTGLYRSVRLVTRPETHVIPGSMDITTPVVTDERATVRVRYRTNHGARDYTFEVPHPRLWSLDDPYLYTLEAEGEKFRYGIRTFRSDADKGFFLNGRRVQLKGVDLHSDMGILGMAFDRDVMRRQLLIMKDMGFNALRTSHNAVAPQVLDLCDEMGVFVWNECFDKWNHFAGLKEDENLEEYISRNLRQFVRRDRNHPCVFCWSIGNEIGPVMQDGKPTGMTTERFRIFRRAVREEDVTRPVAIGCCSGLGHPEVDFSALDMTGWNYGATYRAMHAKYPKMPVLYSESASAVSEYGFYEQPPAADKTSYSRDTLQVGSYDHCAAPWSDIPDVEFDRMEKDLYCGGEFVWTGIDYLGEPTPIANGDNFGIHTNESLTARSSYFGIVDLTGVPKDRFYLYRSYWNPSATTVHILPHWNWSPATKTLPVYVYTNGDEAELFLNGRSLGRRKKLAETKRPNLAAGARAYASSCEKKPEIVRRADFVLDGSNDTRWCAAGGATNEWLAIDFGKKTSFDSVTLELEQPQPSYGYDLQISDDGTNWRPYATKAFGDRMRTIFRHADARYLRVVFTRLKSRAYASVRQLIVNAAADGASPFVPYYDICGKYRLRWFDVPNEPGELKAVAYLKGAKIGEETMRTAEKPVAVRLTECPYNASEARTRFVLVDLVDAKGTRDPLATNRVSFALQGPGELVAVGNANPRGLEVFTDVASHPLYYGKGAAVVRRTGPGKLTLTASVPGLRTASLDIR